ncbi:metal ABC transporter permease [Haloprofundus salilacus]|uniref:metal ABC transporter permease n=1 Tax=Haloprofundus salilacus TaxID=2876190 RepID=UPI001CC9BEF5|nr:metal ABC transporter permease [Haloprofundus salilacus]
MTAFVLSPALFASTLFVVGIAETVVRLLGDGMCDVAGPLGVEMLCYPFMQQAFVAGLCVGVVAPLVGSFLVHRDMAFIGDTLAHTAFAGVAIGLFLGTAFDLGISPYLSALVAAVLAALLIELISEYTDAYGDVSMAIVLSGGFALGTVVISLTDGGIAVGISQYLFGSLSTVTLENASLLLILSGLVVGVVAATYKQLLFVTFDETAARVARVNVERYSRLLIVLTAVVVVAAMQIMGVILVAAMLVVPVAAAAQIARSFRESVLLAVVAGELAVLLGLTASYQYGVAAGGSIVLVAIGVYAIVVVADGVRSARLGRGVASGSKTPTAADGGETATEAENES